MSFNFGRNLKVALFGQSHSDAIGVVIDGLPAGRKIDFEAVARFMARRAPGRDALATPRNEQDQPEILSGVVDDYTCGAPLAALIRNNDMRSKDYARLRDIPRPMHADYPAAEKYNGWNDIRGGGQFSGRLTAPLCFAGALCLQLLHEKGVMIGSHLASIGEVDDDLFDPVQVNADQLKTLATQQMPVLNVEIGERMRQRIQRAKEDMDSVGGTVECCALGLPVGLGEHMFDGIESWLAHALFAIPAVRGVEFGAGFGSSRMAGSRHNDPYYYAESGALLTRSNHHGGVLGGMTTGMPLVFRVAFKPTSSIGVSQDSVSLSQKKNVKLTVEGRHDPCIVLRAAPVVEAVAALVLYDFYLTEGFDGNR